MELDIKNQKILRELDLDPRATTSKIAKKVRLSQQVVDYRIKTLMKKGIIKRFGTIFNLSKIGYQQYRILFQVGKSEEVERQRLFEYLKKHNQVYWAALIGNKWDLFVALFVKNYHDLERFLDDIFAEFRIVKDYTSLYVVYHDYFRHKYLFQKQIDEPAVQLDFAESRENLSLDVLDIQILRAIRNNCRTPSLEIAAANEVNYKTVQNRIATLTKKGLIAGYRSFYKSETFGYKAYLLFISFRFYNKRVEKKLFAYARTTPLITQRLSLFGSHSLLLHKTE